MKIITVNLPTSYLKAIDMLIGDKGLYPSRSELIRVAVREFLNAELESAKSVLGLLPKGLEIVPKSDGLHLKWPKTESPQISEEETRQMQAELGTIQNTREKSDFRFDINEWFEKFKCQEAQK